MTPPLLESPLGQALLKAERDLLAPVLEGVFGEVFVQLGRWGDPRQFLALARTQRRFLVDEAPGDGIGAVLRPEQLPFLSDSVDVMLLPHTLDYCRHPHAALREASRALRSDGQLIILAFKPGGLWGLRRLVPRLACPAATQRLIATRSMSDWLELLNLRILEHHRYFFRWPRPSAGHPVAEAWERRGERFWPEFAACYMLRAQKRLHTLTPVRQRWRPPAKVVAGLIEPSVRYLEPRAATTTTEPTETRPRGRR